MRLAYAGTAAFGVAVLEGLLASEHEVVVTVTTPDKPRGRRGAPQPSECKQAALGHGVPVLQPDDLSAPASLTELLSHAPDVLVACAYGRIVGQPVLDALLSVVVHPSLVPRWRGAAPVERALMIGDAETGVTIHETVKELDAGPICAQAVFPLTLEDDAGSVYEKTAALAVTLLDGVLPDPVFEPQPEEGACYAAKIGPEDRELDWSRPPQESLNRIRALSPHIGAWSELNGQRLLVWRARLASPDAALVAGGLELLEVQPEGKKRMSAADYLRGVRR